MGIARRHKQADSEALLDTNIAESQAPGALELDPFAFHLGAASRIRGLGGTAATHDPEYAFHTPYVEAAEGTARFTVRFHGLAARLGTLLLRVHMTPIEPGSATRLVNSERIALNRLIALGGEISIAFEGFRDVVFALVGTVSGETDAAADGLTVTLDRPADPTARREIGAEAKSTAYGNTPLTPIATLLSTSKPTLADPVTQIATAAQLREPAAGGWIARLRPQGNSGVEHWRKVYTLQALRRYGMLEHGAVGLGFEPTPSGVPAALAAMQTHVVAAFPSRPGRPLNPVTLKRDLNGRAPCDPAILNENVQVRIASWRQIPEDLLNFDFVWSARANEQLFSVAATATFVQDVMACLRPGGLAIHTMSYDLSPGGRSTPSSERILLQQGDVERIALLLVSRGHEVAQFKIATQDPILAPANHGVTHRTMVGIIARKARLD
ncbi:MAG TPA: hypothetical protein VNT42_09240 [Sphingomonas sp.]|nr:hypothetical protein [Sphingomonas sp.]